MDNTQDVGIKFKNSVTGQAKLERYERSLKNIQKLLKNMPNTNLPNYKEVDKTNNSIEETSEEAKKMTKALSTAFDVSKLTIFVRKIGNLVQKMSSLTDVSATYLENMNLLDVAYNGNTVSASKLVNKMSEMYGLDESWGYRTVGIFKQLSNAMGLTDETGTKLSNTLTQLSVDLSSLYNTSTSDAVDKLTSALAGQTKPIRAFGADITENTLQQTLWNNQINLTIDNLSYVEKRLLIVTSILQQTNESWGDWGRTVESVANQMRVMDEQISRLSRALGNVFMPILKTIIPYVNAFLMVLTEIINWIAVLVGYDETEFDYFTGLDDSINDVVSSLDEASESASKLKSGLRGFDKLNVITTPSSTSSATTGGVNADILDLFNKTSDSYLSSLTDVEMKATKIRDTIMEWLGFTKLTDNETGDISFKFDHITGGTVLGALAVGGVIYSGIKMILKILSKIGLIKFDSITSLISKLTSKKILSTGISKLSTLGSKLLNFVTGPVGIAIGIIAVLTIAFIQLYNSNEEFRNKVDDLWKKLSTDLVPILERLWKIAQVLLKGIIEIVQQLYKDILKPLWELLKKMLLPVFEIIIDVLKMLWSFVLKPLVNLLLDVIEAVLPIVLKMIENIIKVINVVIEVLTWLWDHILEPIVNYLWEKVKPKIEQVFSIINNGIEGLRSGIQKVVDWWNNLSFNKKKISVEYQTKGGGGTGAQGGIIDVIMGGRANGGILVNNAWKDITAYAGGGLPKVGQYFLAREAGPELVGNIGNHTAVMNNNQIVSSVSDGVYKAVKSAMSSTSSDNQIYNIYLDENHKLGTYTLSQLKSMAKDSGKPITIGG